MKINSRIYYIAIISWFILLTVLSCRTEIENKSDLINFLQGIGHEIQIDPVNADFSDLEPLREAVGQAEIVMLGEISHGDGSSLMAKSRLVQYLCDSLNFEVLVFESGLFDCFNSWNLISNTEISADSAFAQGVFQVWSKSKYVSPLIEYISKKAKTQNPLELAGMDIQLTGDIKPKIRKQMIESHLKSIDSMQDFKQYKGLDELFDDPKQFLVVKNKNDTLKKNQIFSEIGQIESLFSSTDLTDKKNKIYLRYIQNMERFFYFNWNMNFNNIDSKIANIRDEEMANNLIWLKEEIYPGKKIIVWGANSHLMHNRHLLYYPDKMVPMGDLVKLRYKEKVHVIGFTCYSGSVGSIAKNGIQPVPEASNKSIEYLLHEGGFKFAFFKTSEIEERNIIDSIYIARFLGFSNKRARWNNMIDSFIFIDNMKPNEKNN